MLVLNVSDVGKLSKSACSPRLFCIRETTTGVPVAIVFSCDVFSLDRSDHNKSILYLPTSFRNE